MANWTDQHQQLKAGDDLDDMLHLNYFERVAPRTRTGTIRLAYRYSRNPDAAIFLLDWLMDVDLKPPSVVRITVQTTRAKRPTYSVWMDNEQGPDHFWCESSAPTLPLAIARIAMHFDEEDAIDALWLRLAAHRRTVSPLPWHTSPTQTDAPPTLPCIETPNPPRLPPS